MRRKAIFDMVLNLIASAIPIVVLQLIILPSLSRDMADAAYGLLVTILSLLNVVPATFGGSLNNIRLLHDAEHKEKGYTGDYNVLLLIMTGLNLVVVGAFSYYYEHTITPLSLILTLLVSVAWLMREYFIVAFRLIINYKAILLNNLLQVAGYGLGYLLYRLTDRWQLIYLTGYMVSLIYIFARSSLWREKVTITPLFKKVTWQNAWLTASNLLNRILNYADKMLIYPILGGAATSVLYAATLSGKIISLLIGPINSVMLTYLAKMTRKRDNVFRTTFGMGIAVCAAGYVFCVLISRPLLGLIYPQFVDEAMQYILITTGTAISSALISVVNPFILRFFDMKWQIALNGGTVVVYLALCMTLLHFYGMYGFCVGALLTNFCKLIAMLCIYKKGKTLSAQVSDENVRNIDSMDGNV